jgi:D-3-phosphoglycerate dehydrogenase
MSTVVLYLDKISAPMEDLVTKSFSGIADVRFLNPTHGKKGELDKAHHVLVTNYFVTKDVIDNAPLLKMIQRTGVGYDNVDVKYALQKNIPVSITLGTNASSVAELVIGYILALYRKLILLDKQSRAGVWDSWKYRHLSYEILGKTVGIIGMGAIGKELLKRLSPFGAKFIYYDVTPLRPERERELGIGYCSLDELLREADIISLHVPWNEKTRGLISREKLGLLKKNAILINTARGPVVDQVALTEALREGRIAGAGLDVFDPEPFTPDCELLTLENVVATPHVGAATLDNYERVFAFCAANVERLESGRQPENVINGVK